MNTSTSSGSPGSLRIVLTAAVALTAGVLAGSFLLAGRPVAGTSIEPVEDDRVVAARVGDQALYLDEIRIVGTGSGPEAWVDDELLAQLASESGLEDPIVSSFVQRRARQLYLRDELLSQAFSAIAPPTEEDAFGLMRTDSLLYMVERHYFEILVADSMLAESLLTRLRAGQSFQVTAENLSLGQRAALGGDMGFLVGGELTGRGLPGTIGRLEGLSGVNSSEYGWHIFLVTETRPLTDTARVVQSLCQVIETQRRGETVDSLLTAARTGRDVEVDESCWH